MALRGDSMVEVFSIIPDPRKQNHSQRTHLLIDVIVMTICAVVGGANNWVEVELFCSHHDKWFKKLLGSKLKIPSHDTFWRIFSLLDSNEFENLFRQWVQKTYRKLPKQVINIDGKSLDGTVKSYPQKKDAIHIVNAWASESGLVLGMNKAKVKGLYERDQMVELIKVLHLNGCIVTMDAMGTTQASCEEIIERKGSYVLAVKKNQRSTYENIISLMENNKKGASYETSENGRSREEKRVYRLLKPTKELIQKWPGLKSIGEVSVTRSSPDTQRNGKARLKTSNETRYYITSIASSHIHKFAHAVRSHWSIENELHWGLDVAFDEDKCRSVIRNGAENFAIVRRIAFNLINRENTAKLSKKHKRLRAGWDVNYLKQVVFG